MKLNVKDKRTVYNLDANHKETTKKNYSGREAKVSHRKGWQEIIWVAER